MYSSISRVVTVAAFSLVACGGDDSGGGGADPEEFLGNYQVTSHRENHQQGTPVSCSNLYAGTSRLSLDGDVATFEDRQWSSFDVPESDCTLEAADALIGTPDCQDVVVRVGTRL